MELRLAFIGFGNVARAFARLLESRRQLLHERYDITWRATAIATATRGCVFSPNINLDEAVKRAERGEGLAEMSGATPAADSIEIIESCAADIIFETSPLSPFDGEPAATHIRRALARGVNVVTANKGPLAYAYREIEATARRNNALFRFEGAVMDGTPVFNLVERCLPAARVTGFYGILNSTTNLILTEMEKGRQFRDALAEAKRIGVAEANADYDIDGWDAAVKAVALANVLMGADARPRDVARSGIRDITAGDVESAARAGCAIKLVARADSAAGGLKISVAPERVPASSLLAAARGTSSVLAINTDLMGELTVFETDPGVEQTAYALLSDMISVCEDAADLGGMKNRPRMNADETD
jgi:homoserine dehydrogenase